MKNKNGGFSLVELIVAMAIFVIAGLAIFSFVSYSSGSYKRTNEDVKLQYDQQLAVNQVRDLLVEATAGIYYDASSNSLAIYSRSTDSAGNVKYPVTRVTYDEVKKTLSVGKKVFDNAADISFADVTDLKLMAENVTKFEADLTNVKKNKVTFQMGFEINGKGHEVTETVALRNRLVVSNEVDTIFDDAGPIKDSFISRISIMRGTTVFPAAGNDEIGKLGDSVTVEYKALVSATEDSTREYAVTWSLENNPVGVTINGSKVTVSGDVLDGTTFKLYAISVDDPTKFAYINITVTDNGIYPVSGTLIDPPQSYDGNGFRRYTFSSELLYSDGHVSIDPTKFNWHGVDSLPDGCHFDVTTGELTLTNNANGRIFHIYGVSVENDAQGNPVITNTIALEVNGIPEYISGPVLNLQVTNSLKRGGYVFPTVTFRNSEHSSYTYKWVIEPYQDGESAEWNVSGDPTTSFNLVTLSTDAKFDYNGSNPVHELETDGANRTIAINCSSKLSWKKTFKIKVSAYATDAEGNVLVAEAKYLSLNPVKFTLTPTDLVEGQSFPFSNVVTCKDRYNGQQRWFFMTTEGIHITGSSGLGLRDRNIAFTPSYVFYDSTGTLLEVTSNIPTALEHGNAMCYGFASSPSPWYDPYLTDNTVKYPTVMKYALYLSDNEYPEQNNATTNFTTFTFRYDDYEPAW